MRITNQYIWNIIFLLFFLALVYWGITVLEDSAHRSYESLTFFDLALITLASFRFIRFVVYDKITAFFREQFYDAIEQEGVVLLIKPQKGLRRTLADLLACPWCFGVWATTTVTFFYLLTEHAFFPVLLLALSGVATLLQLFANMIGWKAEQLKADTELR